MSPQPGEDVTPAGLRDRWRDACWSGDAGVELVTLEAWLSTSAEWADRATRDPQSLPPGDWAAAAELERVARWPTVRAGQPPTVEATERPVVFARAAGDAVELELAAQGLATDLLRLRPDEAARDAVVKQARRAGGTRRQRARACLNAAWAVRSAQGPEAVRWGQEGLALLGPVGPDDPRPDREIALHLLQQAGEFLPWPEKSVMARSMLGLLGPGEHPAWRARILRRLWATAVENHAPEADGILQECVAAAIASARARSMMEVGAGLLSAARFAEIPARRIVDPLRRLALAADPRENPQAAVTVEGFLLEVLLALGDDRAAHSVGREALATLEELRTGRTRALTCRATVADWDRWWATLAAPVATAAARLGRHDEAATLARRCVQVHRDHGSNPAAATTALELASYRQDGGDHTAALAALELAAELAQDEPDRDLQAHAWARRAQVTLELHGPQAGIEACIRAERRITSLAGQATDPLERGLVMWEALDVRRLHAEILAGRGELAAAAAHLDGVADGFLTHGYPGQAGEALVVAGHYLSSLGDVHAAEATWRRAITVTADETDAWIHRQAVDVLAAWLTDRGRAAEAERLRAENASN